MKTSPQLMAVGQMLGMCVDMAKGTMGDQFAVTILCRHRQGPMHLLLGDDTELAMMAALSDLQRGGTTLVKDGEEQDEPATAHFDTMVDLLREVRDYLATDKPMTPGHAERRVRPASQALVEKIDKALVGTGPEATQ